MVLQLKPSDGKTSYDQHLTMSEKAITLNFLPKYVLKAGPK